MSKLVVSQKIKLAVKNGHGCIKIRVGDVTIGGDQLAVMAGPCSVESREQVLETARVVKAAGGHMLRGGAFKPRTLPYSFQGLGEEGLKILAEARGETGLPIITEVMAIVPTDCTELLPNHAYTSDGSKLAYKPVTGGSPETIA